MTDWNFIGRFLLFASKGKPRKAVKPDRRITPSNINLIKEFFTAFPETKKNTRFREGSHPQMIWSIPPLCSPQDEYTITLPAPSFYPNGFGKFLLTDYFCAKVQENRALPPPAPSPVEGFNMEQYWETLIFDHESGHRLYLSSKAHLSAHENECVSDVYSLLRHYQRFGTETGFPQALLKARGRLIGFMNEEYSSNHMTAVCLNHVIEKVDKAQLVAMPPRKIWALALEIVTEKALTRAQSDNLHRLCIKAAPAKKSANPTAFPLAIAVLLTKEKNIPPSLAAIWLESVHSLHQFGEADQRRLLAAKDGIKPGQRLNMRKLKTDLCAT